jgi:putative transposase
LRVANSKAYRNLSPRQIVPRLADCGEYLCSESTLFRFLRQAGQLEHRGRHKPAERSRPAPKVATAANQIWCWDISYLPSRVRGAFYYLYMVEDVFSRTIVGYSIEEHESMDRSAALLEHCFFAEGLSRGQLILHSDNGGPMKGSTMLASLKRLGVMASFSRPAVSNDNPFIESLFRTVKYCPSYPYKGFEDIEAARRWFDVFVPWYNHEHLHSAIGFVTPAQRHAGQDHAILAQRKAVYDLARQKNPGRWSGKTRNWERIAEVRLNGN